MERVVPFDTRQAAIPGEIGKGKNTMRFSLQLAFVLSSAFVVSAMGATSASAAQPVESPASEGQMQPAVTCYYTIYDSPTPIHSTYSESSPVVRWKYNGDVVTGPCVGVSSGGDGQPTETWYELYLSGGGYGWVNSQHLYPAG